MHIGQRERKIVRAEREPSAWGASRPTRRSPRPRSSPLDQVDEVRDAARTVTSLDRPIGEEGETPFGDCSRAEPASRGEVEGEPARGALRRTIEELPETERDVIGSDTGLEDDEPQPLRETGRRLGLSAERVRQIESRALKRLAMRRELEALRGEVPKKKKGQRLSERRPRGSTACSDWPLRPLPGRRRRIPARAHPGAHDAERHHCQVEPGREVRSSRRPPGECARAGRAARGRGRPAPGARRRPRRTPAGRASVGSTSWNIWPRALRDTSGRGRAADRDNDARPRRPSKVQGSCRPQPRAATDRQRSGVRSAS